MEVCQVLRDEFEFNFLCELTAVDYWPEEEPRFNVIYGYYSHAKNVRMALRVPLNGDAPPPHHRRCLSEEQTGTSASCGICSASILKVIPIYAAS